MKKICKCCQLDKELTEFSIKKNGLFGKNSVCKQCVKVKAEARKKRVQLLMENNSLVSEKKCTKCDVVKSATAFTQDITKKDGLYSSCKDCNKEVYSNYRINNHDKIARGKKLAVMKKAEYYSSYKKNWYEENKETLTERRKEYYIQNKQELNQANKAYRQKKRAT